MKGCPRAKPAGEYVAILSRLQQVRLGGWVDGGKEYRRLHGSQEEQKDVEVDVNASVSVSWATAVEIHKMHVVARGKKSRTR